MSLPRRGAACVGMGIVLRSCGRGFNWCSCGEV